MSNHFAAALYIGSILRILRPDRGSRAGEPSTVRPGGVPETAAHLILPWPCPFFRSVFSLSPSVRALKEAPGIAYNDGTDRKLERIRHRCVTAVFPDAEFHISQERGRGICCLLLSGRES